MPSRLQSQITFEPFSAPPIHRRTQSPPSPSTTEPAQKRQKKMSLTQTYYIASTARGKLNKEASRTDFNLRLLVGHANLLDALTLELADAEREQEAWFHKQVRSAEEKEPRRVQWIDKLAEVSEEDEDSASEASDSESDCSDDDYEMAIPLTRIRSPPVRVTSREVEVDSEEEYDTESDDEDYYDEDVHAPELALVRTVSQSQSPPELLVDDSESDDETPPQSPPQPNLDLTLFDEKSQMVLLEEEDESTRDLLIRESYYLPRNTPMISAC